ncbi:uncharacterized protein LOC111878052 [Lactuca sativa]|uniref:uncharacterized protein LOC111878052 n=1 Tax=Lactuca sativa TaxID=4236 RepID=UPI000CD8FE0D|nr:uncharacterized protein LOC111878052 [Lactuca sativa]
MLTSPIQHQPLFTNIPFQPNYFQQQLPQSQFQGFQQFRPQQFQTQPSQQFQTQPSQVPCPQSPTINLDNDEDDRFEETQPSRRRKSKGKATNRRGTTWIEEEEEALAKAWISISCDSRTGNAQTRTSFWVRVLDHFHSLLGRQTGRTYDAVNGKWRELRAACTKFNGIFENLKNMHKSGSNDFNILSTACQQFKVTTGGKAFGH